MKRTSFWTVTIYFVVLVAIVVAIFAYDSSSHLLLKVGNFELQARLWATVVCLGVLTPIVVKTFKLLYLLLSGAWFKRRIAISQQKNMTEGLQAYIEGDWYTAVKKFKAINNKALANPSYIALLFGAKAAERIEKRELCDAWLEKAILNSQFDNRLAARLTQIKILVGRQDFRKGLDIINSLELQHKERPEIIRQQVICLLKLEQWQELSQLFEYSNEVINRLFGISKTAKISEKLQNGLAAKDNLQAKTEPTASSSL